MSIREKMPYLNEILLILSSVLIIAGFIFCFVPILPGPPVSYGALLLLQWSTYGNFTTDFLIKFAIVTFAVVLLDYLMPLMGAKRFGGTRRGVWGAGIGLGIGMIFFPPIGIIVGPFVGALIGELTMGKEFAEALKSSFGSMVGVLAGVVLKVIVSGLMLFYYIGQVFGSG